MVNRDKNANKAAAEMVTDQEMMRTQDATLSIAGDSVSVIAADTAWFVSYFISEPNCPSETQSRIPLHTATQKNGLYNPLKLLKVLRNSHTFER